MIHTIKFRESKLNFCFLHYLLLSLITLPVITSQTYIDPNQSSTDPKALMESLGSAFVSNVNLKNIQGNSVFLTQIGSYNDSTVNTNTANSSITILQDGSYNITNLDYTARTAYANIEQRGNSNTIIDNINNVSLDVSLELSQQGNNLNFIRDNANELTKTLKFSQTEASPNLIVRSIN